MKRFWSKVDMSGECWLWTASRDRQGYGYFGCKHKTHKSHRVAWELENGPIPEGLSVCHMCDNPSCVRPAHLFLGTTQDNQRDDFAKSRQAKGVSHGHAVLDSLDIWLIRKAHDLLPVSDRVIARAWGIHQTTVSRLTRRATYT